MSPLSFRCHQRAAKQLVPQPGAGQPSAPGAVDSLLAVLTSAQPAGRASCRGPVNKATGHGGSTAGAAERAGRRGHGQAPRASEASSPRGKPVCTAALRLVLGQAGTSATAVPVPGEGWWAAQEQPPAALGGSRGQCRAVLALRKQQNRSRAAVGYRHARGAASGPPARLAGGFLWSVLLPPLLRAACRSPGTPAIERS